MVRKEKARTKVTRKEMTKAKAKGKVKAKAMAKAQELTLTPMPVPQAAKTAYLTLKEFASTTNPD